MLQLRLTHFEFASLLSYTPRPAGSPGQQSKNLMLALKTGRVTGSPPLPVPTQIAEYLRRNLGGIATLTRFLSPGSVLVPVPKSSLHRKGSLWVPLQIAEALVRVGLGERVATLLNRTEAIPKAASSRPSERPSALRHFQSIAVQQELTPISDILLVDDLVTRGDALMGCANRLFESYPHVRVKAFAAMRTISNESEFRRTMDPVTGWIELQSDGHCLRRP